jgi:lipopolysaccharide biosynthesis glycosyltransferase
MNLVYMAVFHNRQYLELLKLLMASVKLFSGATTDIEFLVLTSPEFAPAVQEIAVLTGIPIRKKLFGFSSVFEASCARLHVFEYEDIERYEKILYLDTDMLVQGQLTTLFQENIEDRIYALPERSVTWEHFGGWFYDFKKINKNTPGMNGGILLFRNTPTVVNFVLWFILQCRSRMRF